ncbi:MAG: RraA family protein [Lachnospiraceae bacterium]|nr:RraA family protein [Lachnospiraceae bacterium]
MADIKKEIIDYLTRNRVSTTEVADALGKTGVLPDLVPVNRRHYKAGEIKWIYAYEESNWPIHEQIQNIEDGCVIFVENFDCGDRAIFGELVSKYLLLYHQSKALVIDGKMRDASALIKENWPIWCDGFNPVGCFNREPSKPLDEEIKKEHFEKYDGAIAVCDDCGVVVIPKEKITDEFLKALHHMEDQEDIWFDRLDHCKENTFEIVCQKKYLKDDVYMSRRK